MSNSVQRRPTPPPGPEPELARARMGIVRVLPWVQARARKRVPARLLSRLASSPEDLAQLAALSALGRMESIARRTGALPDWCASEATLRRYLGGILWRLTMRLVRDSRGGRTEQSVSEVHPEPARRIPMEQAEDRALARSCLAHLSAPELSLIVGFGEGASYAELSARLGASPDTLAKRRERILSRLRARCQDCAYRKDRGCTWIPPNWAA